MKWMGFGSYANLAWNSLKQVRQAYSKHTDLLLYRSQFIAMFLEFFSHLVGVSFRPQTSKRRGYAERSLVISIFWKVIENPFYFMS